MTVNLSRKDIAQAFEGIGGIKGLIKWAKANNANRAAFYSMFRNEIAAIIASGAAPEPTGDKQLVAVFEQAFRGAINGARRKNIDGAAYDVPKQIDGVIDCRPARGDISDDGIRDTPAPQPQPNDGIQKPPPDEQHATLHEQPSPPKAKATPPPTPDSYLQPSATELFYTWSNNARPSWSAPRGWGGS